jgi:hypothetical protein
MAPRDALAEIREQREMGVSAANNHEMFGHEGSSEAVRLAEAHAAG